MPDVVVSLHAQAADLAKTAEVAIPLPPEATCADVKRALAARCPGLARLLDFSALATDREYLADAARIVAGDRLHLIPPVSGG